MSFIHGKPLTPYSEKQFLRTPKEPKPLKAKKEKPAALEGFEPEYLKWISKQPCIITGLRTGDRWTDPHGHTCFYFVVRAHMKAGRTKGTDATALPVGDFYHKQQHVMGIVSWQREHKLDIPALIAAHRKRYALECAEKARTKEAGK